MHNGSLLIDMHVHLARYEVLSASTRDWFISLYPSEAAYQAVCEANASPDDSAPCWRRRAWTTP